MTLDHKDLELVSEFVNSFWCVGRVVFDELLVKPDRLKVGGGDLAATKKFFSRHLASSAKRVKANRGA